MNTRNSLWSAMLPVGMRGWDDLSPCPPMACACASPTAGNCCAGPAGSGTSTSATATRRSPQAMQAAHTEGLLPRPRYENSLRPPGAPSAALAHCRRPDHSGACVFSTSGGAANDAADEAGPPLPGAARGRQRNGWSWAWTAATTGSPSAAFALTGEELGQRRTAWTSGSSRHVRRTTRRSRSPARAALRRPDRGAWWSSRCSAPAPVAADERLHATALLELRRQTRVPAGGRRGRHRLRPHRDYFASSGGRSAPDIVITSKGLTNGRCRRRRACSSAAHVRRRLRRGRRLGVCTARRRPGRR